MDEADVTKFICGPINCVEDIYNLPPPFRAGLMLNVLLYKVCGTMKELTISMKDVKDAENGEMNFTADAEKQTIRMHWEPTDEDKKAHNLN